jgi:hypothetical protein
MRVHSTTKILCLAGAVLAAACGGNVAVDGTGTGGKTGAGGSSSSSSSSTSTSGTGTSTGTGTGTSSGTSGGAPLCDCKSAADCAGKPCVALTPGGYMVCEAPPPEATKCAPPGTLPMDQCCASADCKTGKCYLSTSLPQCSGPAMATYNECVSDACATDADCKNGTLPQICTPAGAFGFATRQCLAAYCHTDADCGAKAGGHCATVSQPCCSTPGGLACVYPGGCQKDTDCASDGSKHCQIDATSKQGVCIVGPTACAL